MTRSDISVVLCTFNGARFIRRQIASIVEQDLLPSEIIVNDDRSTDDTLKIVEQAAASTTVPVRIHENTEQLGFAGNFLRACEYTSSRYIAFSDQDDDWYPDKLSAQRASLEIHQAVLSTHPVDYIDARGAALPPPDRAALRDASRTRPSIVEQFHGPPWGNYLGFTMMFDGSLLDRIPADDRGLDPHSHGAPLSHDRWVYFLASTFGRTVVLPRALARYRQHDRQLYGGTKHRSIVERYRGKLVNGQEQAAYREGIARHRADLLAGHGVPEAATAWGRIAEQLGFRAGIYEAPSAVQRVRAVARGVRSGAYRAQTDGGLGRSGLAEDVVVALGRALSGIGDS